MRFQSGAARPTQGFPLAFDTSREQASISQALSSQGPSPSIQDPTFETERAKVYRADKESFRCRFADDCFRSIPSSHRS